MQNDDGGPGDLCLSEEILRLRGIKIPLICIGKPRKSVKKVVAAKDVYIPRQSEAVVYGFIEREEDDKDDTNSEFVVEADKCFEEKSGLSLGRTLVSGNQHAMSPIRVLNGTMEDLMIRQNTCIGLAEKAMGDITTSLHQEALKQEQSVPSHLQDLCQRSGEKKTTEERKLIQYQ